MVTRPLIHFIGVVQIVNLKKRNFAHHDRIKKDWKGVQQKGAKGCNASFKQFTFFGSWVQNLLRTPQIILWSNTWTYSMIQFQYFLPMPRQMRRKVLISCCGRGGGKSLPKFLDLYPPPYYRYEAPVIKEK